MRVLHNVKNAGLGLILCAAFALPAAAQDAKPEAGAGSFVHAPEGCEFSITFPSEPYPTERCAPNDPKRCHIATSFTKVFGVDAAVSFHATCHKAEDGMYERYSGDVMRTTLIGMARPRNLEVFESDFIEYEQAKLAILIGSGLTDDRRDEMLYTAQLWIGKESVFTMEGEVRGTTTDEADRLFADILKSVKIINGPGTPIRHEGDNAPATKNNEQKQAE